MSPSDRGAEVWAQVLELTERLLQAAQDSDEHQLHDLVAERGAVIDGLKTQDAAIPLDSAQVERLIEADRVVCEALRNMLSVAREELGMIRMWQSGLNSYAGGRGQPRFLDRRG